VTVGRNSHPNVACAHQGWFDDEQRYFHLRVADRMTLFD